MKVDIVMVNLNKVITKIQGFGATGVPGLGLVDNVNIIST